MVSKKETAFQSRLLFLLLSFGAFCRGALFASPFRGGAPQGAVGWLLRRTPPLRVRCAHPPPLAGGGRAVSLKLRGVEGVVRAALCHQLVVRALLDDVAVVHHEDAVGVLDGREAVRDDERGLAGNELADGRLQLLDPAS